MKMPREYINIGSTPCDETCLGVGHQNARKEVELYREQLEKEFPNGSFRVKGFPHDFGTYYEVVAFYNDDCNGDDPEMQAAYDAEGNEGSPTWLPEFAQRAAALRVTA